MKAKVKVALKGSVNEMANKPVTVSLQRQNDSGSDPSRSMSQTGPYTGFRRVFK